MVASDILALAIAPRPCICNVFHITQWRLGLVPSSAHCVRLIPRQEKFGTARTLRFVARLLDGEPMTDAGLSPDVSERLAEEKNSSRAYRAQNGGFAGPS
jgi:hypothetical protein